jgi:hypothetical protein
MSLPFEDILSIEPYSLAREEKGRSYLIVYAH